MLSSGSTASLWHMSHRAAAIEHIFHWGLGPWQCVQCCNCRAVQKRPGNRNVWCDRVLAKEIETSSTFIFVSKRNREGLVLVKSSLLSPAVQAATGESFRSRPLSSSMNRSVCLHCPACHLLNSLWEGGLVADLKRSIVCKLSFNCELWFHADV